MKKLLLLAFAGAMMATSALADDIYGVWRTIADDNGYYGHIDVYDCDGKICGKLIGSFVAADDSVYDSDNVGKMVIWDMQNLGGGEYGKGKIHSFDRDTTYKSKLTLTGDSLAVFGCVFGICRDGGTWSRVN